MRASLVLAFALLPFTLLPLPAAAQEQAPPETPPKATAGTVTRTKSDAAKATPLINAIQANDAAKVAALLGKGANVNVTDASGSTPLMQAAAASGPEVARLLIDKGANVNAQDSEGFTPLMIAAYSGKTAVAQALIDRGADIHAADTKGRTALMGAAYSGQTDTVKLLIDKGADIRTVDSDGFTALMVAAGSGNTDSVRLLLDRGADANTATKTGFTPLMQASGAGKTEVVQVLLERGANVNARAQRGSTALHVAAYAGHGPIVKLLLDRGGDARVTDSIGRTPLIGAAYSGSVEAARSLLERRADLEAKTRSGLNSLMQACYSGRIEVVKLFLERGANVHARTELGLTPLMHAAGRGDEEIARLLLLRGADINAVDQSDQTAVAWAKKRGQTEIIAFLRKVGGRETADVPERPAALVPLANAPSAAAFPPLHRAADAPAIHGPRVVGASPNRPFLFRIPATGREPLMYAVTGLPEGLKLDAKTGIIMGQIGAAGEYKASVTVTGPAGKASRALTLVCGEGKIALTPPLGWNAWNVYGEKVTAEKVKLQADFLIKTGLAARGFSYIIIDDTWQGRRDTQTGGIGPSQRFGDLKGLADYLHSKGLKLGILSSPNEKTVAGYSGSAGHEEQDAKQYAEWGIDYLKYDWAEEGSTRRSVTPPVVKAAYAKMRAALDKTDRDIVLALTPYGFGDPWEWGREIGANSWWVSGQILDLWDSVRQSAARAQDRASFSSPGHWNDPGWLMVGKIDSAAPRFTRLNAAQQMSHITMWSMLAAPLILTCDLTQMDPSALYPVTTALMTNTEVLDIDQDPLGKPARRVRVSGETEVWSRPLFDGTFAVALFNKQGYEQTVSFTWGDAGLSIGSHPVRDVWQQKDLGTVADGYSARIPPYGVVLLKVGTPKE